MSRDTKRLENSKLRSCPEDDRETRREDPALCALRNRGNGPFHVAPRVNVLGIPLSFYRTAACYINSHWLDHRGLL